jgi:spore maturation protein CgeB
LLANLQVPHHQTAVAADPDWYKPLHEPSRPWDISFFGLLYDNRLATLQSILEALPAGVRPKGRFVGPCRSRLHHFRAAQRIGHYPLAAQQLKHGAHWTHEQINELNNQSKICLNIFHPQSVDSLNMRTFEACCSGAFLLCQSNVALGRYFVLGKEVEPYETPQEAADKIAFYLRNNDLARTIAAAGRERVLRDHTMKARTKQILLTLKDDSLL